MVYRLSQLGVGSIGSLVAHHVRSHFPRLPISLILNRRGIPETPRSPNNDFKIRVERDGQIRTTEGYDIEAIGSGLVHAYKDVERLASVEGAGKTGRQQLYTLRQKKTRAIERVSTSLTPNDPIDSLLVTLKCPDTLPALGLIKHRISEDTCITLLQNGMGVYEDICREIWPDRSTRPRFIVGSTTHGAKTQVVKMDRNTSRSIVHTGLGKMTFGVVPDPQGKGEDDEILFPTFEGMTALTPSPTPPLPLRPTGHPNLDLTLGTLLSLSELSPSLVPVELMHQTLLLKLAINASINPLTAIHRVPNGQIVRDNELRRLVRLVAEETSEIILAFLRASSSGEIQGGDQSNLKGDKASTAALRKVEPDFHPPILSPELSALFSPNSIARRTFSVAEQTASNISSMSSHLQKGTSTEIDWINGYLVKMGEKYGVGTEMNRSLISMVTVAGKLVKATEKRKGARQRRIDERTAARREEVRRRKEKQEERSRWERKKKEREAQVAQTTGTVSEL
jgi:2-dehydropantoate 2-reductase